MKRRSAEHTEPSAALGALAAGDLDLITNVGLFTEGIECPRSASCSCSARRCAWRCTCRWWALRPATGKRRALVLDHAGNCLRHGLYDFPHQWSLEGRPKDPRAALVRRCSACGAMVAIAAHDSHRVRLCIRAKLPTPPKLPDTIDGRLERVDNDRALLVTRQSSSMSYRRLLIWITAANDATERQRRAERARRINGYHRAWTRYVLEEATAS
jgi:DNA repair protein RadD